MVRCSDNASYHGDIIVGADGDYSALRQNLYMTLTEGKKPAFQLRLPCWSNNFAGPRGVGTPGDLAECQNVHGVETRCSVCVSRLCRAFQAWIGII